MALAGRVLMLACRSWRAAKGCMNAHLRLCANSRAAAKKKILPSATREASQVYNQNLYTTIVVVLTTVTFCG